MKRVPLLLVAEEVGANKAAEIKTMIATETILIIRLW